MGMPISSVASGNATQQLHGAGAWQQRRQSFDALSQALQSGNVNAAKDAFSSLSKTFPPGVANNPNSPLSKLGQALQTGNLSAAQTVFSTMHGRHHHHNAGAVKASEPVSSPGSTGGLIGSNINVMA